MREIPRQTNPRVVEELRLILGYDDARICAYASAPVIQNDGLDELAEQAERLVIARPHRRP